PPTTDEDAFLEGAGALLGLLLLEHLGEGRYDREGERHGLRVGPHFFDPFAALEAAIEAPRPRAELSRWVGEAEAEARGEGPTARVVAAFTRRLAQARPELSVSSGSGLRLTLSGGVEVDLERVARATDGAPGAALDA